MRRLIIGMTGSTGAIFGVRMLEALKGSDVESHLIISKWAQRTLEHETPYTVEQVRSLASVVHSQGDMGAAISSGSFKTDGMAVMPCSVHTLAGIANGYGEHLVHRAADVVLKERRRLVLVVRETPFSEVHLENMLKLARFGGGSSGLRLLEFIPSEAHSSPVSTEALPCLTQGQFPRARPSFVPTAE